MPDSNSTLLSSEDENVTLLNTEEVFEIRVVTQQTSIRNVDGDNYLVRGHEIDKTAIVVNDTASIHLDVVERVSLKEVIRGVPGPRGIQGIQGPQGRLDSFTYEVPVASKTWHIVHNLGHFPFTIVEDSAGGQYCPDVRYIDLNTIEINFAYAIGGKAILT